jgi:hypothetical protein
VYNLTGFLLWRQYRRQYWGKNFRGVSPSKMGRFSPFLATIQALSKSCVFLFNKRSEGCFVSDAPPLVLAPAIFIIALFSWVSVGDRLQLVLKLAKEVQSCTRVEIIKYTSLKYLCLYKNYRYSIYWGSGTTGLVRWNSSWIESLFVREGLSLRL